MVFKITDLTLDDPIFTTKRQDPTTVTFDEDPLVLACCLKRFQGGFSNINSDELRSLIIDQDRIDAKTIRKYYTKKFFWQRMKSNELLSPFRETAAMLLAQDNRTVDSSVIGIFVRLPWFYEEDQLYDKFKKTVTPIANKSTNQRLRFGKEWRYSTSNDYTTVHLHPAGTSLRWNAKKLFENFWFTDQDSYLYNISIDSVNPLLKIFKEEIKLDTVQFSTRLIQRNIDDLSFYRMSDYKIIKE